MCTADRNDVLPWCVDVYNKDNVFANHINGLFISGTPIEKTCLALSRAYPGERVVLKAHATVRAAWIDEVLVQDNPDITKRYTNMTPTQIHEFKGMFSLTE